MESFDLGELKPGEELLVTTETGSVYHFLAEATPEPLDASNRLFRGFRATRESDHLIEGRPEVIENEPTVLLIRPGGSRELDGTLQAGDGMELIWDRDHPESAEWDIQFGPRFHDLYTSRVMGIELVPVDEN